MIVSLLLFAGRAGFIGRSLGDYVPAFDPLRTACEYICLMGIAAPFSLARLGLSID
ncbi:MAG: hypothetical protein WDN30_01155 [Pararobbsia sp.]